MYRLTMPGAVFSGEEALSSIQSLVSAAIISACLRIPASFGQAWRIVCWPR